MVEGLSICIRCRRNFVSGGSVIATVYHFSSIVAFSENYDLLPTDGQDDDKCGDDDGNDEKETRTKTTTPTPTPTPTARE